MQLRLREPSLFLGPRSLSGTLLRKSFRQPKHHTSWCGPGDVSCNLKPPSLSSSLTLLAVSTLPRLVFLPFASGTMMEEENLQLPRGSAEALRRSDVFGARQETVAAELCWAGSTLSNTATLPETCAAVISEEADNSTSYARLSGPSRGGETGADARPAECAVSRMAAPPLLDKVGGGGVTPSPDGTRRTPPSETARRPLERAARNS